MKRMRLAAFGLIIALVGAIFVAAPERAEALVGSEFDAGYIISDEKFFDKNAMSQAQIQAFLDSKVSSCRAGYTCLKDYRMDTFNRAAVGSGHCAAYAGESNERASQIIYKVSQACGINPQVMLVLLQKETSLITDTWPTALEYRKAAGYGCPDTSDCDASFYGFYNQVYSAAKQFRQYTNFPDRQYRIGNVRVQYHPNAGCGSSVVNIKNQATANLYNYTPYQPNAAALANLGGSGDGCSAYGNRNFWVFFNDWFGPTTSPSSPTGNLEQLVGGIGGVTVSGWAFDPDTTGPISVHVYVNGVGVAITANQPRPDVGAAYPGIGDFHGFSTTIPVTSSGNQNVCVYAINVGTGANVVIKCGVVFAQGGSPFGVFDSATPVDGGVKVAGWAIDPDTASPMDVHVYVDAVGTALSANSPRPDIAAGFPGYGERHGYSVKVDATPGTHNVCVYGINVGAGTNVSFGCRTVTVPGIFEQQRAPIGIVDDISAVTGGINVAGWALDPDTAASIPVHIHVDGASGGYTADKSRPDIGQKYAGYGDKHGFVETLKASPGAHQVCVYAINTGPGGHTLLRCASVTVPGSTGIVERGRMPIGVLDDVRAVDGGINVKGWSIDPDTATPVDVHIYVDAVGTVAKASALRPDVGLAYPGYGDDHGFEQTLAAGAGTYRVCVYGINAGPGAHTLIGCSVVTVAGAPVTPGIPEKGRAPQGVVEDVSAIAGGIGISGWTFDPDTASPIQIHAYLDGVGTAYMADKQRPDVGAAFPGYGDSHGFSEILAAGPGSHQVCVYGINAGPGAHTFLGCYPVLVQ